MIAPTATEVRTWSKVAFAELGYAAPEGADPDLLAPIVDRAVAFMVNVAGVDLASISDTADPVTNPQLYLAQQAVQMLTELEAFRNQGDAAETASDFDLLSSFDVGGYSEQRRSSSIPRTLTPWPALNQLLARLSGAVGGPNSVPQVGVVQPSPVTYKPDWDVARYIIDARTQYTLSYFGVYKPPWW